MATIWPPVKTENPGLQANYGVARDWVATPICSLNVREDRNYKVLREIEGVTGLIFELGAMFLWVVAF